MKIKKIKKTKGKNTSYSRDLNQYIIFIPYLFLYENIKHYTISYRNKYSIMVKALCRQPTKKWRHPYG